MAEKQQQHTVCVTFDSDGEVVSVFVLPVGVPNDKMEEGIHGSLDAAYGEMATYVWVDEGPVTEEAMYNGIDVCGEMHRIDIKNAERATT